MIRQARLARPRCRQILPGHGAGRYGGLAYRPDISDNRRHIPFVLPRGISSAHDRLRMNQGHPSPGHNRNELERRRRRHIREMVEFPSTAVAPIDYMENRVPIPIDFNRGGQIQRNPVRPIPADNCCLKTWAIILGAAHLVTGCIGISNNADKLLNWSKVVSLDNRTKSFTQIDELLVRPYAVKISLYMNSCALGLFLILGTLKKSPEYLCMWIIWFCTLEVVGLIKYAEFESISMAYIFWEILKSLMELCLVSTLNDELMPLPEIAANPPPPPPGNGNLNNITNEAETPQPTESADTVLNVRSSSTSDHTEILIDSENRIGGGSSTNELLRRLNNNNNNNSTTGTSIMSTAHLTSGYSFPQQFPENSDSNSSSLEESSNRTATGQLDAHSSPLRDQRNNCHIS